MSYRVVSYCPDRHILYDGRTPYDAGVGGGITARVRMAKALAYLGNQVTMIVNCARRETIDGVEYVPLDQARATDSDILIVNSSGDGIDLRSVVDLEVTASLRILWLHGTIEPQGLGELELDHTYAVSNFVADTARESWSVQPESIFVTYNAFEEALFGEANSQRQPRDPYQLIYAAHPSKGLESAVAITRLLRGREPAFHLEVYGGNRLWGEPDGDTTWGEGIAYQGLVGQRELAEALLRSSFAMQLQSRDEPFGMAMVEAIRAGCVVLASPVGAYPELIEHGRTGFLVPGDHRSGETRLKAAELILSLVNRQAKVEQIRRESMSIRWDTHRAAVTWVQHWDLLLRPDTLEASRVPIECRRCGGPSLAYPDGYHCTACGLYAPEGRAPSTDVPMPATAGRREGPWAAGPDQAGSS